MAAATLKCLLDRRRNAMICTHRINPACGIPRFLSRFARGAGLVHLRQTFVLRCHGDDGWPLRAEALSNCCLVVQLGGTREIILYRSRLRSCEAMEWSGGSNS